MELKSLRQLATLAALLGSLAPAGAASITSDPPQAKRNGWESDATTSANSWPVESTYIVGPTGGTVTSIVWWGYHGINSGGAGFDNFLVLLDGVQQFGALTESAVPNYTRYELDIADIDVLADQVGTLSITNNSDKVEWYWQLANTDNTQPAFSLQANPGATPAPAPVPEPGSLALAGLALLGLATTARRRRTD